MAHASTDLDEQGFAAIDDGLGALRERLLDEIGLGLIVCDSAGRVRLTNRCAEAELASGGLLCRVGATLRCGARSTVPLDIAIGDAGRSGYRQLVELSGAHDRLLVLAVPLPGGASREALVMVMLGRRDLCSAPGLELLSTVHGLTPAERRVLADLLQECSLREIAQAHGVALSTVRTQVVSIRGKLGVHSVEALLHRVAEVPPMPGAPHVVVDPVRPATCCSPRATGCRWWP